MQLKKPKINLKKLKPSKKVIIIILIVAIIAGGLGTYLHISKSKNSGGAGNSSEFTVTRQDISETISGTATVEPKDQYSITALVSGDVISADFEVGDVVEKGDVLYKIDSSDVEKNIESADLSLEKAQNSYNDAVKNLEDLKVRSDISGVVKTLYVKKGDNVSNGTKIADVYDASYMELVLPFNESDALNISNGASANITVYGTSETLTGTVTHVAGASYAKSGNMLVRDVTIKVANPGVLTTDDTAVATIGGFSCNDSGTFKYIDEGTVTAKTSGTVSALNVKEGDKVYKNSLIATLSSDTLETTLTSSSLSLKESQISKSKSEDQLDDYTITAPISGTVVAKNTKAGDKLDNSKSQSTSSDMAVIFDMSSLQFDMSVDELDINKVAVGQTVKITADAISDKEYSGTIEKININGTTSNGVTSYPVTVTISDFDDELIPGMNINAEIVISSAENVLVVPKTAVARNNVVYVKGDKTEENDRAPEGYKSVTVETGVNDDNYIEIKSGLKEGEKVYITASGNTRSDNGFGGMPGGGGGMPGGGGGGMPGGGGPGGGGGGMPGGR